MYPLSASARLVLSRRYLVSPPLSRLVCIVVALAYSRSPSSQQQSIESESELPTRKQSQTRGPSGGSMPYASSRHGFRLPGNACSSRSDAVLPLPCPVARPCRACDSRGPRSWPRRRPSQFAVPRLHRSALRSSRRVSYVASLQHLPRCSASHSSKVALVLRLVLGSSLSPELEALARPGQLRWTLAGAKQKLETLSRLRNVLREQKEKATGRN